MLEYDRNDISEGTDINKTNASKECNIYHYWFFLDKKFKCESYLLQFLSWFNAKAMNFNDFTIVSVKGSDYRIHFCYMSKNDGKSRSLYFFYCI